MFEPRPLSHKYLKTLSPCSSGLSRFGKAFGSRTEVADDGVWCNRATRSLLSADITWAAGCLLSDGEFNMYMEIRRPYYHLMGVDFVRVCAAIFAALYIRSELRA